MAQIGNKINSYLNGEWAKHGRRDGKKRAARKRRILGQREIQEQLKELQSNPGQEG